MFILDLDLPLQTEKDLHRWMSDVSVDGVVVAKVKRRRYADKVVVRVHADTLHDLDRWLRDHYVMDSAGPALEEDLLTLVYQAEALSSYAERVGSTLMWIFAGSLATFAIWAMVSVLLTGKPW